MDVVHAACPHDCPDTCAMLVTVQDGVATRVEGDPAQPITAGFLCGKVSNYLDRVYAPDRLLRPLLRTGPKGSGEFREASWDEALDAVAAGLKDAIARHGTESVLPYSYLGTMGYLQRDSMSARFFNALGASVLERTICADAGVVGVVMTQGISPEVDPELWDRARYVICWGWNPMSTAPHLWRRLLAARKAGAKLVVIDPYRSRTARVADEHVRPLPGTDAALALALMRAVVDAGLQDEEWCRAHTTGYDDLLGRLHERTAEEWAEPTGVDGETVRRLAAELGSTRPLLVRLGVGAQRHLGAEAAYRTVACLPALVGAWRDEGGGCSYIPTATAGAIDSSPLRREDLRPEGLRTINMSQIGDALTGDLQPPVAAMVVWNSNPAQVAPEQAKVLEGLRRKDLFTVVLEQFMTDTALHADVVLPATTQLEHVDALFSWGHQYVTWNEPAIAPCGEARPNTEVFRLLAARMGLDDPCFAETDQEMLAGLFAGAPGGISLDELRTRGFAKVDHGRGPVPHAEGGFGTSDGRIAFRSEVLAGMGLDPLPGYEPPAEAAGGGAAHPLALLTPKTHLFLNSTFANQARQHSAQPAPFVVLHPDDAGARGIADGQRVRVFNSRGSFEVAAAVSDDAPRGVAVAPMGWWMGDHEGGLGAQATTSQQLTPIARAPIFNDNRVEVEPA